MLINCKECGRQFSNSAKACPQCAAPTPRPVSKGNPWLGAVVFVGLFAVVLLFAYFSNAARQDPEYEAKRTARDAIDACHVMAADELAALSTRREYRNLCGQLERDFREQFGHAP